MRRRLWRNSSNESVDFHSEDKYHEHTRAEMGRGDLQRSAKQNEMFQKKAAHLDEYEKAAYWCRVWSFPEFTLGPTLSMDQVKLWVWRVLSPHMVLLCLFFYTLKCTIDKRLNHPNDTVRLVIFSECTIDKRDWISRMTMCAWSFSLAMIIWLKDEMILCRFRGIEMAVFFCTIHKQLKVFFIIGYRSTHTRISILYLF